MFFTVWSGESSNNFIDTYVSPTATLARDRVRRVCNHEKFSLVLKQRESDVTHRDIFLFCGQMVQFVLENSSELAIEEQKEKSLYCRLLSQLSVPISTPLTSLSGLQGHFTGSSFTKTQKTATIHQQF